MQVALEDTASGTAVGGYDLPDDLTRVTAKDIRDLQRPELHRPKISIGFDKLIEMIQQGDWSELDLAHVDIEPFNRTENGEQHEKQMATMRSLLANGKFSDRFAVTKILAFSGDVEQVPHLIFALTDGDHRITRAARDGLRLISRKFTGFELSDTPSQQEKARAAKRWNAWYRSVRQGSVRITA
jgi:hypothetical protein